MRAEPSPDLTVQLAWLKLPPAHRTLLEQVGASQWQIVDGPLGTVAHRMLRSAGQAGLASSARASLESAFGVWIPALRVLLINASHRDLIGLSAQAYEEFLAYIAWHEWGHALSLARCSHEDLAAGDRLLARAPAGVRESILRAGYLSKSYTHEIIAETYALMMVRRIGGHRGKPEWLHDEIYRLLKRVTDWPD
jgi:hypothetical protein